VNLPIMRGINIAGRQLELAPARGLWLASGMYLESARESDTPALADPACRASRGKGGRQRRDIEDFVLDQRFGKPL